MLKNWIMGCSLAVLLTAGATTAQAADAAEGEKLFKRCAACHVVNAPTNKVGPHLVGIVGRPAGAVEGFNYSDAVKNSGIVWDEANLDKYLENPKGFIAKNKMAFPGLKKPEERASVIAYLKEAAK